MKPIKLAVVGLAVLLLTAGAATALPGEAPAFAGDDDAKADDNRPEHAADASDGTPDVADGDERPADVENRGPPVDLPDAVPEHVSEIHDLVREHLDGTLDVDLGRAIADVTPDQEAADS